MGVSQPFKTDRKLDIAGTHNVLDLKVSKLCLETQLLNDPSIFPSRQFGVVFGFGTCHYHFTRSEDQGCSFGITDTHNHSRKTLKR
jgi:hypothetical protein